MIKEVVNQINENDYFKNTGVTLKSYKENSNLSFDDIKNDIDSGMPIYAWYTDHSVVIVGYGEGATPETSMVYYYDPSGIHSAKAKAYGEFIHDWTNGYIRFEKEGK